MNDDDNLNSRRRNVIALVAAPLLLFRFGISAADTVACFDAESLPAAQKRLRRALGFRLALPDEQNHCGSCAFFAASTGDCGKCEMLSGGVVAAQYVCESWAAKS